MAKVRKAPRIHSLLHAAARVTRTRVSGPSESIPTVEDVARRAAGRCSVRVMHPAQVGNLTPPGDRFDVADPAFREFPAAFVARIDGGAIIEHGVLTERYELIGDLSVEAGVRAADVRSHTLLRRRSVARPRSLSGRIVAAPNAHARNYYHWLIEVVPRLQLLRVAGEMSGDVYVPDISQPFQKETLAHMGLETARPIGARHLRCETLIVPSLAGVMMFPPPWAVEATREALRDLSADGPRHRRLFITRGTSDRRRIANESALRRMLEKQGFAVVDPARMSVAQQRAAFASAEAVVASHGAALANIVFCSPGARVIELAWRDYAPPCYWVIAQHLGLEHSHVWVEPVRPDPHADVEVDLAEVEQALAG